VETKDTYFYFCTFYFAFLFLSGCQSNPTFDTFRTMLPWVKQYEQVQPGFEYILVSANGHEALMALGERRDTIDEFKNRTHEYWYTGQGEMLYLVNGRIHQALGFTNEIRSQTSAEPPWEQLSKSSNSIAWGRKIDLMPGFRYGLVNNITTFKIAAPNFLPEHLPEPMHWIADLVESKSGDGQVWWYLQRFALHDGRVVYSEQCITERLCLKIRNLGILVSSK
jgi:hypothetical protein